MKVGKLCHIYFLLLISTIVFSSENHNLVTKPIDSTPSNLIWTCSMHPQIRMVEKGKCPICFMDLISLSPAKSLPSDTIELDSDQQKNAGIMTHPVRHDHDEKTLLLFGQVNLIPSRVMRVTSWVKGRIEKLYVASAGENVKLGDPLYDIYSPELVAAQQELIQLKKLLDVSSENKERALGLRANLKAVHQKLLYLGLNQADLSEIETLNEPRTRLTIRAQHSGIVRHVAINEGEYVKEGGPLLLLADMLELWIEASVYEDDLQTVRGNIEALIRLDSYPAQEIRAKLVRIDPFIDPKTRTSRAIFSVENPNLEYHEGGYARVQIHTRSEIGLLIPHSAALFTGQKAVVFVQDGNRFQSKLVRILEKTDSFYRVMGDLKPGDLVVTQGTFKLDSEFQIQTRDSMMSSDELISPYGARLNPKSNLQRALDWMRTRSSNPGMKTMLSEMVKDYLDAWEALSEDSIDESIEALDRMAQAVDKIRKLSLQDFEGRIFKWYADELNPLMKKLHGVGSFEDIRLVFAMHSNWLVALAESGWISEMTRLEKKYCPMAFGNEGAFWIQDEKEIRNPYFGSEMPSCGTSQEWGQ